MAALIVGLLFLGAGVFFIVPKAGLDMVNWGPQVWAFIQGGLPIVSLLIGLVAVLIGVADLKDAAEEKKAQAEEKAKETK